MSDDTRRAERLRDLDARIERVGASGDVSLLYRMAAPVFDRFGWKPKLSTAATLSLVEAFRTRAAVGTLMQGEAHVALDAALAELTSNVVNVERLAAVRKRPPVAHASWLRRSHALLSQASRALAQGGGDTGETLAALASANPPVVLVAPLAPVAPIQSEKDSSESVEARQRVVMLELAAVDHLLAAGRAECDVLSRRRRFFEAARQVLLDASAALTLDSEGVRVRQRAIVAEIMRLDRLESAGVDGEVGLAYQARAALTRGEDGRLRALVAALDHVAQTTRDPALARLSRKATRDLYGDVRGISDGARRASLERSADDQLGVEVTAAVRRAYERGRQRLATTTREDRELLGAERGYLGEGTERSLLFASLAVDGAFETGGVLSPTRVVTERVRLRRVPYPAPALALVAAEAVEDIPDAIIEDPRLLVLQLATGRLLARRYVREEVIRSTRVVMVSEVRVFLVDGSGSMIGPRARVRDAMLVAELATLLRRLSSGDSVRCAVYYGFFNDQVGPIVKVDSIDAAKRALEDVCETVRSGGTDIQGALLAAFETVAKARADDADLARAQVVLVTDGEAAVDEATIVAAREMASADVPLGVSVVALGAENGALRGIVARQRAKGERAFYHFVDDETLRAMADGSLDTALPLHLRATPGGAPTVARSLEASVGQVVTELEDLARARDLEALDGIEAERVALREMGAEAVTLVGEGARARIESLQRDRDALTRRFARWFPQPGASQPVTQTLDDEARSDAEAVHVMLASIVEVVRVVGGGELARKADAIELIERLMPDAGITPARYFATLSSHATRVAPALTALHAEVRR